MSTDDRDDLGSCHQGPKIHIITARKFLCIFLLMYISFRLRKKKKFLISPKASMQILPRQNGSR